ncbi:MAG: insulinase family protein [Verrucomicrobia bacterium]|nr:insulinase family protein [Verrucomicrobiota bacterium]MBS0645261.1 insulinase family protein [Verrucomicrobiota bacterium]
MMRLLCLFLFTVLPLCAVTVEDLCTLEIVTPSLKERSIRKLKLDNGLEALLISDPGTTQSGAALAVNIGSWDDPAQRPGMAHFVEHLLFLGTHTYPEEAGYTRYLNEHGGERNAFTMSDRTVYFFSVNHDGFEEALDRFGHFFIDPLFNPSGVARECCAIHQEFCKDVPQDPWRVLYVKKALCQEEHPFHDFCNGNLDTLAKISQDELKSWYKTHYGAQLMHLIVVSPKDLDSLENQVVQLFSKVPQTQFSDTSQLPSLLHSTNQGILVSVTPLQHLQQLELSWELPEHDMSTKSEQLISHLLGHESKGSLLALLKDQQLANGLSAGASRVGKNQMLFSLSIQLTDKGLKEYETVIGYCFQALARYRLTGIPQHIFDEYQKCQTLHYCYQSREDVADFVSDYATAMIDEPLETFPQKTILPTSYHAEQIDRLLTALTPQSCQFFLIASPEKTRLKADQKEPWLGADYSIRHFSDKQLKTWALSTPHPSICLPEPNVYLPENFSLYQDSIQSPLTIENSHTGVCYALGDQEFKVPQISWTFTIKTPAVSIENTKSQVLADLFCHTVSERLNTDSYQAALGGLSFSLSPDTNGLQLIVEGFHDKASLFVEKLLNTLTSTTPTKEEFEHSKELAERCYANACTSSPIAEATDLLWSVLYKDYAGAKKKREALSTVSYHDMKKFSNKVWDKTYVEALLYGNVSQDQAKQVWSAVVQHVHHAPYPSHEHVKKVVASLSDVHILEQKTCLQGNAVILVADLGPFSFKKRAAMDVLCKGLEEPFFSELRTKQQTAYLVRNWGQELERHLYAFFAVQSSSHDTRDLLSRFELFLESHLRQLKTDIIPVECFESIRESLIERLKHPAQNLQSRGRLLNRLAFEYEGDFNWLDKRIEALQSLCYEEFVDFAQQCLGLSKPKRLAICVNGQIPLEEGVHYQTLTSQDKLRQLLEYRKP